MRRFGLLTAILSMIALLASFSPDSLQASESRHAHSHHHKHKNIISKPLFFEEMKQSAVKRQLPVRPHCDTKGHTLLNTECPHIKFSLDLKNKTALSSECPHDRNKNSSNSALFSYIVGEQKDVYVFEFYANKNSALKHSNDSPFITLLEAPNPPPKIVL